MPVNKNVGILLIIITLGAAVFAALIFSHFIILKKSVSAKWREDFSHSVRPGKGALPDGWKLEKKLGTKPAVFSARTDANQGVSYLHMEADKASASLITRPDGVDISKTPFLRWRWRATVLPEGADGRIKARDDQAIGIYVGTGSILDNKNVSYRWDTETPEGSEGSCAYGFGKIKVRWLTLRNKDAVKKGRWFVEERNVAEDFKKAWGFYPQTIYLSIACNSQYTRSSAAADLDWIGFFSHSNK